MPKPDLTVPEQKIASLSYSDASPKAFRKWVSHLPMANLGELSRQLYHAIIELNQLFVAPAQRLQLLELIRPSIRFVCSELSRHYLGMAISLPEKQRKIANLSQALQLHLAAGYKLCILEFLDNGSVDKHKRNLVVCCHRAITELGATLLRAAQLYGPSPQGSWREIHQLYVFALGHGLQDVQVPDDTLRHRAGSTVAQSYVQCLLFGAARTNQLRQSEMEQAYHLFELWADQAPCRPDLTVNALLLVNPECDHPPIYRDLLTTAPGKGWLGLDTEHLARLLSDRLDQDDARSDSRREPLRVAAGIGDGLLSHLAGALGMLVKRNFNRIATDGSLEVCSGLTAVHFFVAGQVSFSTFLTGQEARADDNNRFMRPDTRDAWAAAHDAGVSDDRIMATADSPIQFTRSTTGPEEAAGKNLPRVYLTRLINTSPGGYCVLWSSDIPPTLQAGELLGVREHRNHPWSLAVVRWLRQTRNQGTRVGLELLAPNATPCGVRLIQKTGQNSEFLRGLMLPEIAGIGQPATLITPKLPFQTGSRVTLLHDGREEQALLGTRLEATGSISQFELRRYGRASAQEEGPPIRPGKAAEDDFDSLWPSL